jgi:hypothetical protein
MAPITLAAGPEKIVWAGKLTESIRGIVPPSALRICTGDFIPLSLKLLLTELKKSLYES